MIKQCTKCKKVFSLSDFYKDISHKDGLTSVCKKCWCIRTSKNRKKRDKVRERELSRIREHKHRAQMNDYWWHKISKYHGLDYRDVKMLYEKQNKKCFYCKIDIDYRNLHIEHYYPQKNDKIVIACKDCNRLKWQRTGDEFIVFIKEYASRFF